MLFSIQKTFNEPAGLLMQTSTPLDFCGLAAARFKCFGVRFSFKLKLGSSYSSCRWFRTALGQARAKAKAKAEAKLEKKPQEERLTKAEKKAAKKAKKLRKKEKAEADTQMRQRANCLDKIPCLLSSTGVAGQGPRKPQGQAPAGPPCVLPSDAQRAGVRNKNFSCNKKGTETTSVHELTSGANPTWPLYTANISLRVVKIFV